MSAILYGRGAAELKDIGQEEKERLNVLMEMACDHYEYMIIQSGVLAKAEKEGYREFMILMLMNCEPMRDFVKSRPDYKDTVLCLVNEAEKKLVDETKKRPEKEGEGA